MSKPSRHVLKGQADHATLELERVLRLRPFQKKEKTDQVVLEPRRMEDGKPVTAVMHPIVASQRNPESPGMKMLSPETLHLCKDTEYHLNHILPDECDQEKVYYNLGLPAARESMDFLKFKKGAKGYRRTTNLIVCMGVENSGKTHTCFGAGQISKRRSSQDGLAPRILDSLFSQSKHHVKNRRNLSFGVKMSLMQVIQLKTETPKNDDDSVVQDLLLPSLAKAAATPLRSPSPARHLPSVRNLIATLERTRATVGVASASQNEALVRVHQDDDSNDFVTDAVVKTCRDITEARQLLASGLQAGQKLTSRNMKSHVLAILQPVLMAPDGSVEREGGKIGILDMAGIEQCSQKKRNTAIRPGKDTFGSSSCSDMAYNAVLHCVRSLQHNSMIMSGKTPALDIVDEAYDGVTFDDNTSEISCVSQEKTGKAKGPTFKVVPYRQHNLTMILQPFFSTRQTHTTKLTLLMAAYPGHRDHAEKKSLMNDLELLFEVAREPEEGAAVTGLGKRPLSPILQFSPSSESGGEDEEPIKRIRDEDVPKPSKHFEKILQGEKPLPSAPEIEPESLGHCPYEDEDTENMVPLPPPFAPTAPTDSAVVPAVRHPVPNAPPICDFPGVSLPKASDYASENAYTAQRPVMSNPLESEKVFEKKRPSPSKLYSKNDEPLRPTTTHNIERLEVSTKPKSSSPTKTWLKSTKKTFNNVMHASASAATTGMKMMDKMINTPERLDTHPHVPSHQNYTNANYSHQDYPNANRSEELCTSDIGAVRVRREVKDITANRNKRGGGDGSDNAPPKRMKKLERDNKELLKRNRELEERCASLTAENRDLKRALEAYTQKEWNQEEEEEWQKKRREFAAPSLVQSPVKRHLMDADQVFNTTGRYNFAVGQPQFNLKYPSEFRRASELNRRDREEEEAAAASDFSLPLTKSADRPTSASCEKMRESPHSSASMLRVFQKTLDSVKRRKSSLIPAVKEGED